MKQNYLLLLFIFFSLITTYSQVDGDFQSKTAGNWESVSSWEIYSGGSWTAATTYPGQIAGTYNITIKTGHIITISSNLVTVSMGNLIVNGTLNLNPSSSPNTITLETNTLDINGGILNFNSNKIRLNLPSTAVITLENGGNFTGSCTNNDEIYIGTKKYAACVGGGSSVYTFGEVVASGGNVNAEITTPASGPVTIEGCTLINLIGGYTGTETNVTYKWTIRDPNGFITTLSTGSLTDDSQTTATSFTPTIIGQYLIGLEITTTASATNVETRAFNIIDTTNPVLTAEANQDVNLNASCMITIPNLVDGSTATDNCSGITITQSPLAGTTQAAVHNGTINVTVTATDAAGNTNSKTVVITAKDVTNPVLTAEANQDVNLNASCMITIPNLVDGSTATDNCTGITITQSPLAGTSQAAVHNGTINVTVTATDAAGNTNSKTIVITAKDVTNPVLTAEANQDVNLNTSCMITIPNLVDGSTATDNCSGITITQSPLAGTTQAAVHNGTINVTVTATDAAGNTNSKTVVITAKDVTNPVLTAEANQDVNLNASCMITIPNLVDGSTATDNCTGITITQSPLAGTSQAAVHNGTINVTVTATDAAGNTNSKTIVITAKDVTNPVLTAEANQDVNLNTSCMITIPNLVDGSTATDNCSGITITQSPLAGTTQAAVHNGTINVTVTATDAAGNTNSKTVVITAKDVTNPVLTAEANQDVNLNASCMITIPNLVDGSTATDNCTGITITQSPLAGTTQAAVHNATIIVTVTATDAAGNTNSKTVVITAKDVTNPSLTAGTNQSSSTDAGLCTASVAVTDAVFSDNCSGATIAYSLSGATIKTSTAGQVGTYTFNKGITTINYIVTDAAGLTTSASKTITVNDATNPSLTAGTNQSASTDAGLCTASVAVTDAVFSDNCSGATIAYSLSGATIKTSTAGQVGTYTFNKGVTTINYIVTDAAGLTTSASKTITVNDATNPSLTAGTNQSASTDAGLCTASVAVTDAVFSDNCSGVTIAYSLSGATTKTSTAGQVGTYTFNKGVTTINYIVTDAAGLTTAASKTITINDATNPSLTAGTNQSASTDTGVCTASVAVTDAVFSDNCSGATIAYSLSGATIKTSTAGQVGTYTFNKGITTINYIVTDAAGLTTSASKTITVIDATNPSLTAGTNQSASTDAGLCNASVAVTDAVFSDNCSGATIAYSLSGATTKTSTTGQVGTYTFNKGITTINYIVTDAAGLTTSASKTITVNDATNPSLTAGTNQSASTDAGLCNASVAVTNAVFSDNCSGATIAYSLSGATTKTSTAGQVGTYTFNKGITTINYIVTDAAGLTTSASKTITVNDATNPSLTAGTNQSASTDAGLCNASVAVTDAVFSDNCSGATIAYSLSGATTKTSTTGQVGTYTFNKGVTTINYIVTDAAGLTTSASKTITVIDATNPSLTAGTNQSASTDAGLCNASVAVTDAVFSDNCSGATIAYSLSGATTKTSTAGQVGTYTFNKGVTTINYIVTDAAGNTNTGSKSITVNDNIKPTITAPSNITVYTNTVCTATGVNLGTPTTADNCSVASVINNHPSTTYPLGNTTVIWTVTDSSGNTATANQIITVIDNVPPTITCPTNKTVNTSSNGTGDCYTTVSVGTPITSDNCGVASVIAQVSGVTINTTTYQFPKGNTTITWTVTDNAGLTASCNQIITVVDDENPSISCPADQNVNFGTNCNYTLQDYTSLATTSDNCDSNLTITQSPAAGSLITANQTTVTLTAKDSSNRTSSCTFKVNASDNIPPTAVCKNYTAYLSSNGTVNVAAWNLNNGSSDNCGIVNMTVTPNAFTCSNIGANNVVFTVYDNGGNSASCNAVITVIDNTPPTVICKNFVVVVDAITRVATIKASDIDNGSNDACGIASMTISPSTFADSPNIYTATTILTVTDVNNNSSSCTATVTVEPPKNLNTYLTGVIVNPVPDNPQPPSALVEVTACPGGLTTPKDIQFTLQAIGTYNLQASQILNWEYSNDNGENWTSIPNTAGLLTYTLIGLTSDTFVRLRLTDADDSTIIKTSAEAYARFLPPDEPPIIVSHSALDICLGNSVTINAESFYDQPEGQFGKGGKFNYAQPDGWRVDSLDGYFPASGNNNSEPTWKETNSLNNPNTTFSGINYDTSDNTKFAIAHAVDANRVTTLETPVFSTIGMTSSEAIITFYTAYYFCNGGSGKIELSFDAGNTYTVTLNTMQNDILTAGHTTGVHAYKGSGGSACTKQYLVADAFRYTSINLGQYAGLAGLRIKFTFNSGPSGGTCNNLTFPKHSSNNCTTNQTFSVGSGWAIDDVGFAFAQVDDELEWTDEDGNIIARGTTATVTPVTPGIREYGVTTLVNGCRTDNDAGTNFVNVNTSLAYAGEDYAPLASNCGENSIQLNAYDNTKTAVTNYNKGAWKANLYTVPDTASGDTDYPGTGITGSWSIISATNTSCGNSATFSSTTDPDAIFTADPGTYILRWTLTNGCFDDKNITFIDCKSVDFDGNNDYVSFKDNYNLNSSFSIETWVKPNAVNGTRTVFSRKNSSDNTKGYALNIVNGQVQFNWYNAAGANSITSGSNLIGTNRWYHLAITFDGSSYKLYVDGLELATKNGTAPAPSDSSTKALLGAMDQSAATAVNFFSGWMDEVKIWSKALDIAQIRQMMNQEIEASGTNVNGVVIPLKISGLDADNNGIEDNPVTWNDLTGYYRMNTNCGDLTAYKGVSGRLHNINSSLQQTAPIPYTSRVSNQTWNTDNTWTNYDVWDVPNSLGINNQPIDWNIVKTNHKITANTQDLNLLGLIVMSNELIITNSGTQDEYNAGHGLWITHYLKLDGKIDLVGESQLVQKKYTTSQFIESTLEENSTGYIERDQQGKQNSFNYNYWSSPVSNRGAANNSSYSMINILRDGTDTTNPKSITFGDGPYFADSSISNPIKISNRWIWTYSSLTPNSNTNWDNYWQWQYKSSTGLIAVADGFTMKGTGGSAPINDEQNYVFTGKPNSGTINKFIALNQTYLVGNPYPSALDADEFIKDNLKDCAGCRGTSNTFGGALYFWDHFGLSNNHVLAQYEGGYATYTLTGGVAAIADDPLNVNNGATGTKIPQRYIPVGQAFYIDATGGSTVQGGTFSFKNSQRAFVREASGNSTFMKMANDKNYFAAKETVDKRMKIRLGFDTSIGIHRQILLGTDPNTTNKFDLGYDAKMIEIKDNDMYWQLENLPLIIQGIPSIDTNQIIPFGLKISNEGNATIKIDALENIPNTLDIYVYDNVTKTYFDLRKENFVVNLAPGEYNNRFSLQFMNKNFNSNETTISNGIICYYTNENQILNIKNSFTDVTIKTVYLFNIAKQNIGKWNITDKDQNLIQIPINKVSSSVYLVLIKTDKGEFTEKIIIK
ncbi:HYR domain-containing protein [Flavobacterium flavipallidum]|uniref:HYR domain-containing protein n=1 Tax=Flavobacterium flavipallidum TaxID=3139140 RepID=A0ABU9HPY7_9FLAO